jgi:hypothetical protein
MDNTGKKSFLIIFSDVYLAYSPSTLNLFYALKKHHNVELVAARQLASFSDNKVADDDIKYIDFKVKRNIFNIIHLVFYKISDRFTRPSENIRQKRNLYNNQTRAIIAYLKNTKKEIIAIDFMVLWCAQQAGKKAHVLSLEIYQNDRYFENVRLSNIKSLIIQSQERLDYLFPKEKPKYFIVQNSPETINFVPAYEQRKKTDLLYCGSSVLGFGIITCLDFIKDYKEYTLTVKGAFPKETAYVVNEFYADLIAEKRLIIDTEYLSETDLTYYISKFRIGFAFYDFYRFSHLRTFNYFTAPSGKVFRYLNSGVPIIANTLPGFQFIDENRCGKLIEYLSSLQIKSAIDSIEKDYFLYAENAKSISYHYDFSTMIQPFLAYVS